MEEVKDFWLDKERCCTTCKEIRLIVSEFVQNQFGTKNRHPRSLARASSCTTTATRLSESFRAKFGTESFFCVCGRGRARER